MQAEVRKYVYKHKTLASAIEQLNLFAANRELFTKKHPDTEFGIKFFTSVNSSEYTIEIYTCNLKETSLGQQQTPQTKKLLKKLLP